MLEWKAVPSGGSLDPHRHDLPRAVLQDRSFTADDDEKGGISVGRMILSTCRNPPV